MQKIFQFKSDDIESMNALNSILENDPNLRIVNVSTVAIGDCKTMNTFVLQKAEDYKCKLNENKSNEKKKKPEEDLAKNLAAVSDVFTNLMKVLVDEDDGK